MLLILSTVVHYLYIVMFSGLKPNSLFGEILVYFEESEAYFRHIINYLQNVLNGKGVNQNIKKRKSVI